MRSNLLKYSALSVVSLLGLHSTVKAEKQNVRPVSEKPNVIILFTDDQGFADVGCYGAKRFKTPNLDRMAEQGTRFTNFYVAASSCTPSRASLLTGCYPKRVGLPAVVDDNSKIGLSPNELTIADYLKQNSYQTAMIGKWHLGHQEEFMPLRHGFSEFYGIPYSMDMWKFHPKPSHNYPPLPFYENEKVVEYDPDVNEMTSRLTKKAVSFIDENQDKPFFIYLPYSQPHVPLGASKRFRGKSEQGLYGDAIMELDWSVGEILNKLDQLGISENTIVMFSSDNGPWLSYGNHAGSAGNLREGKGTTFDGGQKVPFIVRMPGTVPKGKVNNQVVSALDLLPTIVEFTNAHVAGADRIKIDGNNILPLLKGEKMKSLNDRAFFFINKEVVEAVRVGKWKLHISHKYRIVNSTGNDGLPGDQNNVGGETPIALYNLNKDVGERENLAAKYPKKVSELKTLIDEFDKELNENKRSPGRVE